MKVSPPTYGSIRFTRPPVIVSAPVSASVTWKSCSGWVPWNVIGWRLPRRIVKSLFSAS